MHLNLVDKFLSDFFIHIHNFEKNNWDHLRFKHHPNRKESTFNPQTAKQNFAFILCNIDHFEWIHNQLSDVYSKDLLEKLLLFKVLGHLHVRLPLNTDQFWMNYDSIDRKYMIEEGAFRQGDRLLNIYFLPELDIKLIGTPLTILTLFQYKQYFYSRSNDIGPVKGDIVIDGGACRGDVALHFAHAVGENGQVHAFEFVPANLEFLIKNIEMNSALSARIKIVEKALSQQTGERLYYEDRGPSTCLSGNASAGAATDTISIDHYVASQNLARVDFIKMDIEGSEENALMGAYHTIKRFKPKLSICIYHKPDDFYKLPFIIQKINPGYRFYIDHYTIYEEETVLYAIDESREVLR